MTKQQTFNPASTVLLSTQAPKNGGGGIMLRCRFDDKGTEFLFGKVKKGIHKRVRVDMEGTRLVYTRIEDGGGKPEKQGSQIRRAYVTVCDQYAVTIPLALFHLNQVMFKLDVQAMHSRGPNGKAQIIVELPAEPFMSAATDTAPTIVRSSVPKVEQPSNPVEAARAANAMMDFAKINFVVLDEDGQEHVITRIVGSVPRKTEVTYFEDRPTIGEARFAS